MLIRLMLLLSLITSNTIFSQERIDIEGALTISNSDIETPKAGTIRWNGSDFQGYNGLIWVSLTGHASAGVLRDTIGNEYKTIRIGNQVWMAEDLLTSKFTNGDNIPGIPDAEDWAEAIGPGASIYDNDLGSIANYGLIYNGFAKKDSRGLCPTGWHIPDDNEWQELISYLGSKAGNRMKISSGNHWIDELHFPNNESGFSGKSGGNRDPYTGVFEGKGQKVFYWSSSAGRFYALNADRSNLSASSVEDQLGCYVRCIED